MFERLNPRMFAAERMERCKLQQCRAACCLYGVWMDTLEADRLLAHVDVIAPHMPETLRDPVVWFDGRREADVNSRSGEVVHSNVLPDAAHYGGTACVFLRADYKCALQVAADASGLDPWHFKPFYCILHPLDLDEQGRITVDEAALLLEEEGSCLRPSAEPVLLAETFEPELRYFLGEEAYAQLLAQLKGTGR